MVMEINNNYLSLEFQSTEKLIWLDGLKQSPGVLFRRDFPFFQGQLQLGISFGDFLRAETVESEAYQDFGKFSVNK